LKLATWVLMETYIFRI